MKMGILDRFDTSSYFEYNYLIQTQIEVIQDDMEIKEKDLQLSCFKFFNIQT